MKKTLMIALAMLAGSVASAATTMDWTTKYEWTNGSGTLDFGGGFADDNQFGSVGGQTYKPWAGELDVTGSFAIDFTVKHMSGDNFAWDDIFSFKVSTLTPGEDGQGNVAGSLWAHIQTGINQNGAFYVFKDKELESQVTSFDIKPDSTRPLFDATALADSKELNIRIESNAVDHTLSIYVNGSDQPFTFNDWYATGLDGIQFGAGFEAAKDVNLNAVFELSNVAIQVGTATPEPTTATLSLLALAGLCARRRRK